VIYAPYLKKRLPLYVVAVLCLSILLAVNVLLFRRNLAMEESLDKVRTASIKKSRMLRETGEIEEKIARIERMTPDRFRDMPETEILLWGADRARAAFSAEGFHVSEIGKSGFNKTLPVEVQFSFRSYGHLLRGLSRLEAEAFPSFRAEAFSFAKTAPDKAGCRIKGHLVTPAKGDGKG